MLIQRAFKVRLYPTPEQADFFNRTLGCCRLLKDNKEALYTHKYKTEKEYKAQFEFLKEADAFALQQARRNLESAYTNFYKSLKGQRRGENMGFPRFKSKKEHHESYRTGQAVEPEKVIGLDMSLQNFYVDSLGNSPEYKRKYRESEEKLALLHTKRSFVDGLRENQTGAGTGKRQGLK
jgi:transposase